MTGVPKPPLPLPTPMVPLGPSDVPVETRLAIMDKEIIMDVECPSHWGFTIKMNKTAAIGLGDQLIKLAGTL